MSSYTYIRILNEDAVVTELITTKKKKGGGISLWFTK